MMLVYGGGLYIYGDSTQSPSVNHHLSIMMQLIMVMKYIHLQSPTISLINTYFNNPNNNNNIYEFQGTPTWKTCSDNLCTETPFTGNCTAVDDTNPRFGVICNRRYTCNRGKYYNFTTKNCIDCPIGKHGNISNTNTQFLPEQQSCALCPNGRYANIIGISTECFGCPHGMYGKSDKIGATSTFNGCENCSSGTYGNVTGAETELDGCFPCEFGKYSNKIEQQIVKIVLLVNTEYNYAQQVHLMDVKNCSSGTYGNIAGAETKEIGCNNTCSWNIRENYRR